MVGRKSVRHWIPSITREDLESGQYDDVTRCKSHMIKMNTITEEGFEATFRRADVRISSAESENISLLLDEKGPTDT